MGRTGRERAWTGLDMGGLGMCCECPGLGMVWTGHALGLIWAGHGLVWTLAWLSMGWRWDGPDVSEWAGLGLGMG